MKYLKKVYGKVKNKGLELYRRFRPVKVGVESKSKFVTLYDIKGWGRKVDKTEVYGLTNVFIEPRLYIRCPICNKAHKDYGPCPKLHLKKVFCDICKQKGIERPFYAHLKGNEKEQLAYQLDLHKQQVHTQEYSQQVNRDVVRENGSNYLKPVVFEGWPELQEKLRQEGIDRANKQLEGHCQYVNA